MSNAIIIVYINFVLISQLEKDHGMIETRRLKNVVFSIQTILIFLLTMFNNWFVTS